MDTLNEIKTRLSKKILNIKEHSERKFYLDIDKKDIVEAAKMSFFDLGLRFATATGIDTAKGIEIIYHFADDKAGIIINYRVLLTDKKNLEIDSIGKYIKAAEWIEREIWELLGVNFKGHPNLTHLLLIDEWPEGELPLRHEHKHKRGRKE